MNAHGILTASSLRAHDRKGREGKGRDRKGSSIQDQVDLLTVGAPILDLVWGSR